MWCVPPKHNAEFVFHMENVLEVYHRPYDPRFPLICMDELTKQLTIETQTPLKAKPGRSECFDYEYERNGTANIFVFTEPLTGWRHIAVTDHRTRTDWALEIRKLVDIHRPNAERITLVGAWGQTLVFVFGTKNSGSNWEKNQEPMFDPRPDAGPGGPLDSNN